MDCQEVNVLQYMVTCLVSVLSREAQHLVQLLLDGLLLLPLTKTAPTQNGIELIKWPPAWFVGSNIETSQAEIITHLQNGNAACFLGYQGCKLLLVHL